MTITDAEREQHRLESNRRSYSHRLGLSGMPKGLQSDGLGLDDLDGEHRGDAIDAARRFATGELLGLVLTGQFGVGKTTIAAAAARAYLLHVGKPLRWLRVHEITTNLGLGFDHPLRGETIEALRTSCATVLDDLDKTRPTAFAAEPLFSAIDSAVGDRKPLIVTTNLALGELAKFWPHPFGEGIASRLVGYCEIHVIEGADRRVGS
jgi:DNA replication protein DnaC